jgi:hypothetical protein
MSKRILSEEQKSFQNSLRRLNNEGLFSFKNDDPSQTKYMLLKLRLNIGIMEKVQNMGLQDEYMNVLHPSRARR